MKHIKQFVLDILENQIGGFIALMMGFAIFAVSLAYALNINKIHEVKVCPHCGQEIQSK